MATMNVLDASGATVAVEKPLAPGRAAAASSRPVALSTEDLAALAALVCFTPVPGSTTSLACSTTATAAQSCTAGEVLRFGNAGSVAIGVRFGDSTVAAAITAATAMDIMPGTAEAFTVPAGATHYSAVMASGTGTLKVTRGAGV